MAITLLQINSFMFDEQAIINKFNTTNRLGIDCILECIDKKMLMLDKLQHHVLFLKGRTGSGKSTCLPSRLFKHLDTNKNDKPKIVVNVVEPRVILAQSISQDNCDNESYLKFGINTGYYTGAGKTDIKGPSKLVYMTTDLFRMKLNKGKGLGDIVIIDECHVLDRPTIITLKKNKKYLYDISIPNSRKPLFIFASATINLDLMIKYFFGESEISSSKITMKDIYQDALMINHITGLRNFKVKEEFITDNEEMKFKNNEQEFVKYIMTEGIEKSINSKETWNGLPARDILIFSYGMGFNKLFENYCKSESFENTNDKIKLNKYFDEDCRKNEENKDYENNEKNEENKNCGKNEENYENEYYEDYEDYENNEENEIEENERNELNEIEHNLDNISKEIDNYLSGGSKYPIYMSTMKYDDSERLKSWRNKNKGKFRILILPYGSSCKGFASNLLSMTYDPDIDSQQYEIKIYISTDAIETGKTVNTWYQIYDVGLRLSKLVNPLLYNSNQRQMLTKHPITQSASIQRCGRVGRKCPGISIRVFTKKTWDKMSFDSLPDNVNLVSIAQLNLECRDELKNADCVKYNDYIQPNSFDTNLMTGQDLVCSGYTTPWGEYINDVRDYREPAAAWILKAEEIYYINNSNLFDTLIRCRYSRKNISDLLSSSKFEIDKLPENMNDVDNSTITSIYEARQEYVKFLIGNSKIFKNIKKN